MLKRLTFLHIVFVVFISTTISAEYARADGKYNIKVRVNEDIITNYDIEQRKKIYSLLKIPTFDNQNSIIEDLINNKIQTQYAQSLRISLSNEEIKSEVKTFLNERNVDRTVLLKILEQNGVSWLSFKKYISEGKIWKKAVLKSFRKNANISDNKLNNSYVKNSYSYVSKVSLSEIVIPFAERGKESNIIKYNLII